MFGNARLVLARTGGGDGSAIDGQSSGPVQTQLSPPPPPLPPLPPPQPLLFVGMTVPPVWVAVPSRDSAPKVGMARLYSGWWGEDCDDSMCWGC